MRARHHNEQKLRGGLHRIRDPLGVVMLDTDKVRAAFPHLARSVYLNTAAAGLSWRGQAEATAEFYDSGKAKGMGGALEWAAKVTGAKAKPAF